MADDTLKYAVAGLGELADLYAKSKALDMANTQFLIQREDRIAERDLRAKERLEAQSFQEKMFGLQKEFTRSEAVLNREARNTAAELQVLLSHDRDLRTELVASEKEHLKLFDVNPVYATSGSKDISKHMGEGMESLINVIHGNIETKNQKLSSIATQKSDLMKQYTAYENIAMDIAGQTTVVEMPEYLKWRDEVTGEGGQFEGLTELPGAKAAWRDEHRTPGARSRASNFVVRQKKAESVGRAENLWKTIQSTITDKTQLGSDPDKWEKAFPRSYNIALRAFSNPNFEDFMFTYNNAPQEFRDELTAQGNINEQLGHLITHANAIRGLELEASGWSPDPLPQQREYDHEVAINKLQALDTMSATKEQLFAWHKNNVPAYASRDQHNLAFAEVENILHSRGETGDFVSEYMNWINTGKIRGAEDSNIYAGQEDRWGDTGVDFWDKVGGDYLWDENLKVIYREKPSGKEYYLKLGKTGEKPISGTEEFLMGTRDWFSEAEAKKYLPELFKMKKSKKVSPEEILDMKWMEREFAEYEKDELTRDSDMKWMEREFAEYERDSELMAPDPATLKTVYQSDRYDPETLRKLFDSEQWDEYRRSLTDSTGAIRTWDNVLEEWRQGGEAYTNFIDSSYQAIEDSISREEDLVEEQRILDSLAAVKTWDDRLKHWKEGEEAYTQHMDSSYKAIEDSLLRLETDEEGRRMFGPAWDDFDAVTAEWDPKEYSDPFILEDSVWR